MDLPAVSVVIPARDAASSIAGCVAAVRAQTYGGPLEIVVAEGASRDATRGELARIDGPDLTVIDNPDGTTPAGLNRAVAAAGGSVIVRCDAHAILPPDYVETAVRILAETGAANVGGVQAAVGSTTLQRAIAAAMTSPLGVGDARFHYGGSAGPADTVYLGTFDRAILDEVGGFDERLLRNQDYELNHRLRTSGHVVWFDPRLRVEYTPRASLAALWRQYFDYGRWKRRMLSGHPRALRWRQLAPPLLVLGILGSAVLALTPARPLGGVIPLAYAAFLVVGAIATAARRRTAAALLLPVVLPTMHVAWGTGFLFGSTR